VTESNKNVFDVAAARKTGIFQSWAMCHKQVGQLSGER
jgi:viroplasmin and RNaseH domain-containing protein